MPVAVSGGVLAAVQARINARLSAEIHDGYTAAALSFSTGLVIVAALVLLRPSLRRRTRAFASDLRRGVFPWPLTLGGLGGATFVLSQNLTVGVLGVALFLVCVVAGQTATGLLVDRRGLGPGGSRPLTVPRVVGSLLMILAVVISVGAGMTGAPLSPLVLLPIVAGVAVGLQQAVNGRVSQHTGHFLVATLDNFIVGAGALVVLAIAHALVTGRLPGALPPEPVLYTGGAIGVAFIAMAAALAKPLGVLTLAMTTIAGQIVGSVALDALVPQQGTELTLATVAGALLTLVAAGVTVLPARRARA
ncbi:DMT family transporter [Brachybacterium sp. EF45031]|nr:DMT family transporter [Brachybacterium sillae]